MNIKDLETKLNSLNVDIAEILKRAEYIDYDDMSGIEDYNECKFNADKLQLLDEYQSVLYKLQEVSATLKYLQKPISAVGYLDKKSNGRYSLNGIELTSGHGIEWLCDTNDMYYDYDNDACLPYWRASSIEHNGKDYYIVDCKVEDITTVKVRLR